MGQARRLAAWLSRGEARLFRFCEAPALAPRLALVALVLSSPALFLGPYLDDVIARYIYSDLPGAKQLFGMYSAMFGVSRGVDDNLWQREHGWAPWWTYEQLRIRLWRPLSVWTHRLDATLWPDSPAALHAHSLLWLGLLVLAVTRMYRRVHGALLGGMAALLFALDHTHGFEVGYVANRHTLIAGVWGALALAEHARARGQRSRVRGEGPAVAAWLAPTFYALALGSSEAAVAVCGYLFAYALCVEDGPWLRRALSVAPYAAITLAWRAGYALAGYGAHGSGAYVDPAADPLRFLSNLLARGPVLWQAAFSPLPADLFTISAGPGGTALLLFSVAVCAAVGLALAPLLARDRHTRFWALGALLSLVPAGATFASNRQLLFTSFGAVALVAQLWQLYAVEWRDRALQGGPSLARGLATGLLFVRLGLSPLMLPFTTCSIAFTTPLHRSHEGVAEDLGGKDVVFVTAPDDLTVRLAQLVRRIDGRPLPRRWRMLSLGAQALTVKRSDAYTLELGYEGGLLGDEFTELFRDRHLPMRAGERVRLRGLAIDVLAVTADGRPLRVRFVFDAPLDADAFVFYAWQGERMVRWHPPAIGGSATLPAARTPWGLW